MYLREIKNRTVPLIKLKWKLSHNSSTLTCDHLNSAPLQPEHMQRCSFEPLLSQTKLFVQWKISGPRLRPDPWSAASAQWTIGNDGSGRLNFCDILSWVEGKWWRCGIAADIQATHPLPPPGFYVTLYKAFLSASQAWCVYTAYWLALALAVAVPLTLQGQHSY